MKKLVFFIILITLIGLIVYSNSLLNKFVDDDIDQIVENPYVHSLKYIPEYFLGSTFNPSGTTKLQGSFYRPIPTLMYAVIYSIFSDRSFFYHLFQIIIHISNSILVFLILKKIIREKLAFIMSLLFLIHPMNVESVSYISSLQVVLSFLFGNLALYLYLSNVKKKLFVVIFLILLSLFSKESGVVYFGLILFHSFYIKDRSLFSKYILATFFGLCLYFLMRFAFAQINYYHMTFVPIASLPLFTRLINIPGMLYYYLSTFLFPKDLATYQNWYIKTPTIDNLLLPLSFCIAIFSLLIWGLINTYKVNKNKHSFCYLFLIYFVCNILLVLNIIPLDMTVADRWFYPAMFGLLAMIGIILDSLFNKIQRIYWLFYMVITIAIVSLSIRTVIRNSDWKDSYTLHLHDSQVYLAKNSFALENALGNDLYLRGKQDLAKEHFLKSIFLSPNWWTNWNNLGTVFVKERNFEKAKRSYQKSIDNGNFISAYINYASLLLHYDDPKKAKTFNVKALELFPYNADLWLNLALIYYKQGNIEKAISLLSYSYKLKPNITTYNLYMNIINNKKIIIEE